MSRTEDSEENTTETEVIPPVDPDEYAQLIKDIVKYTAVTVGVLAGSLMILHTISEVVVNMSKNNDKDDE
jgi:ribosomal protein S25